MGNYKIIEVEFIERTNALIDQYYNHMDKYPFSEQYNYTLIINCLLGLIVFPKEKNISYIPTDKLNKEYSKKIGLEETVLSEEIDTIRKLIINLSNSVAHFDFEFISEGDSKNIDWIEFRNGKNIIIKFKASEIIIFLKYYSNLLTNNIKKYKKK